MDKIHHIAVQIEDVKSAVDWYSKQFDVEVTYQDETWAMLKFDNISLAMVVPGRHPLTLLLKMSRMKNTVS